MPDFSGIQVGFNVNDLLQSSSSYSKIFVLFIVLVLAIKLAPAIFVFLFSIIGGKKTKKGGGSRKGSGRRSNKMDTAALYKGSRVITSNRSELDNYVRKNARGGRNVYVW